MGCNANYTHCATHCKPETKKTVDSSNACVCLYRSVKLLTGDHKSREWQHWCVVFFHGMIRSGLCLFAYNHDSQTVHCVAMPCPWWVVLAFQGCHTFKSKLSTILLNELIKRIQCNFIILPSNSYCWTSAIIYCKSVVLNLFSTTLPLSNCPLFHVPWLWISFKTKCYM